MPNVETLTKRSYKYWGLLSDIITFGIPVIYLIFNYSIFKKGDMQFTAIAWVIIILALGFLKKFITKFVLDIRDNFGKFAKRMTATTTLMIVVIMLMLSHFWIKDLILLLGMFVISMGLSMYPYYKYTNNRNRYERLKGISEDERDKQNIKEGKIIVK